MSVGVLPSRRFFHWESASKPAINRCGFRSTSFPHPATIPHSDTILVQHALYPCPHHHRHHHPHRSRRRHLTSESPPWPRRTSEVPPPSLASSWFTDTASLLTSDSLSGEGSFFSADATIITPDTLFVSCRTFVSGSMSSAGAARSTIENSGSGPSTAAAREVKQYLSRTLFPRPSSTLHGYASLYHRLKKLPASHRKARQAKTHAAADAASEAMQQEAQPPYDLDDVDHITEKIHSPPRIEIHIYVPTATAAAASAATAPEGETAPDPY
ncbi:uncharacterized protein [Procambarus clarkii]|uniref:uncharacterized protein n=1 Tax=Procambarus clarkii TaxID=6728 RepID=UPI001E676373|nr:uncharacterized protein LOC123759576 [Procambarus clarkii]